MVRQEERTIDLRQKPTLTALGTSPGIRSRAIRCKSGRLGSQLARLRATTGLKLPDCCVLLAVEDAAPSLAPSDERLAQAAESRDVSTVRARP